MRMFRFLPFILFLFCVIFFSANAIHEDEQGLRDWILRFVGHVEHTAFNPNMGVNNIYVTSTQGAVAALSFSDGALVWRKLFSKPQVCIGADRLGVLVTSREGTAYLLNPKNGAIDNTYKLLLPAGAAIESCTIEKRKITVAARGSSKAFIYMFEATTDDDVISPTREVSIEADTRGLSVRDGRRLWVVRQAGVDRHSFTDAAAVTHVALEGASAAVFAPEDVAVVASASKVTVVRDTKKMEEIDCDRCGAGVLLSTSGVFEGVVRSKTEKDGFTIMLPSSTLHVRYQQSAASAAPTVLLAVRKESYGVFVVVRTANGHLVAVSTKVDGKLWERAEGLAHITATVIADNYVHEDHFSFQKVALAVSSYGLVYSIPVLGMGTNISILADVSDVIIQKASVDSMESVKIERLTLGEASTATLLASSTLNQVSVVIDILTGAIKEAKTHKNMLVVAPTFEVTRSLKISGNILANNMHFFTVNASSGVIEGYVLSASSFTAIPLWTLRMPSSLISYSTGEDTLRTTYVNLLRVFPNKTSSTEEVRSKYPTRNLLVVAHYEKSEEELTTLVVSAIDTITGSILTVVRHRNVEGPVHMLVVEHTVLYHFMDAEKMRHCLGVWEIFEHEVGHVIRKDAGATPPLMITSLLPQQKRVFSSRATRPPVVTVAVLGIAGGNLAAMDATTSFNGIAHKNVIFAFESGRIAMVELDKLLAGGQIPLDDKGTQMTHIIIPSTSLASHKFRVAKPRILSTRPTNLESSCHLLVSGLDLFYVRASSGKAFDILNSDFNKNLLVTLTCALGVLTLLARYLVVRKSLKHLWK